MGEKRKLLLASLVTLGFLLCLELCTAFRIEVRDELEHGQNTSTKTVTRVKRHTSCDRHSNPSLTDCGYHGISEETCEGMGCCYDSNNGADPHCFIGFGGTYSQRGSHCDFGRPTERRDCGWHGITQSECESKNCCYDDRVSGVVSHCFYSNGGSTGSGLKTGYSSGCNWAGCENINYASFGDLKVDSESDGTMSTFGSKTNTWNNIEGVGASADVHLAHLTRGNSWSGWEANVGKVGAKASLGAEGVGAKLEATLAEFGGKVGEGPLSIGAKVGLSGDTGIRIGPTTEFKVLGTGVSVGSENGFETCLFGSCVNIG